MVIDFLFLGLAALFGALSWRERRRSPGRPPPAARTWRRLSLVFLVAGIALLLFLRSGLF